MSKLWDFKLFAQIFRFVCSRFFVFCSKITFFAPKDTCDVVLRVGADAEALRAHIGALMMGAIRAIGSWGAAAQSHSKETKHNV